MKLRELAMAAKLRPQIGLSQSNSRWLSQLAAFSSGRPVPIVAWAILVPSGASQKPIRWARSARPFGLSAARGLRGLGGAAGGWAGAALALAALAS